MAATAPTTDARTASIAEPSANRSARSAPLKISVNRNASDDEILGLGEHAQAPAPTRSSARSLRAACTSDARRDSVVIPSPPAGEAGAARDLSSAAPGSTRGNSSDADNVARDSVATSPHANTATHAAAVAEPEHLRAALDANPELRAAWQDANAYRETFATPEDAHAATASLADLDRMDALFFSRRPEDHAELARAVAKLDPAAFASLSHAMAQLAQVAGPSFPSPSVQNRQQDAGATQPTAAPVDNSRGLNPQPRRGRNLSRA